MSGTLPTHLSSNSAEVTGVYNQFGTGQTLGPPSTNSSGAEMLLQATEMFCSVPKLTGMKRAAAEAALAAHDCGTKVTKKRVKKRRKRNRVVSQLTPPGATDVPGTAVEIVVGKFKQRR
jgi:beta-lactam-binding protein with PASTA domain